PLAVRTERDAELRGEALVPLFDEPELLFLRIAARRRQQLLQTVGDAGQRRVHDEHPCALCMAGRRHLGDVAPVGERGNTGSAEFENDPVGRGASHKNIPQAGGGEGCHRMGPPPRPNEESSSPPRRKRGAGTPGRPARIMQRCYNSSSKSRRSFSSFLSARTSSSRLHAALPRFTWLRERLSTRSSSRS